MNKKTQKRNSAFTLIEMLVVLAIIAILGGVAGLKIIQNIDKAKVTSAKAQISIFCKAIDNYKLHTGIFPDYLEDLMEAPTDVKGWDGPYIEGTGIPLDPWDNSYDYFPPDVDGREYTVMSYGADGEEGGEGINADIDNYSLTNTEE